MGLRFVLDPPLTGVLRDEIVDLWCTVTNTGGAVGFVGQVTPDDVWPTARAEFAAVDEGRDRLLAGFEGGRLVAMLFVTDNNFVLKDHWRILKRVMVHPDRQGLGYGAALVREAERVGREMGLDALHLTVRDGAGVTEFYARCGYKEVGRLPGALRVAADDDRDEVLMWLSLR
ncbi:GNAT family N-acetyltransferase [Polymorphospora sp. NPDC050346]|uniref:GNAT family N-acetyltransferase n=1 Tax=Polymorphospora sp. NPDC050346 TaxID=3155780 RepID=UPI0033CD0BE6